MRFPATHHRKPVQGDVRVRHDPFSVLFAVTLTVSLCVAPIIIFILD